MGRARRFPLQCAGLALFALVVLASFAASLHAAPDESVDQLDRRMGQLWQAKRYGEVIVVALRLYRKTADPRLLANIGRCYDLMQRDVEAIDYYRRYLRGEPDKSRHAVVEARIAELRRRLGKTMRQLTIESSPRGAAIWIDGRRLAATTTPHTLWLRLGRHVIETRLAGYRPLRRALIVVAGPKQPLLFELVRAPRSGRLALTLDRDGVRVSIDGKPVGVTPLAPISLSTGRHRVELRLPGGPLHRWVEIRASETTELRLVVPLPPAPRRRMPPIRIAAWVSLGLGAALLATGLGLHLDGWKINKDADDRVHQLDASGQLTEALYRQYNARFDKSHDRLRMAIGFYSAGTALVITSVVLFLVRPSSRRDVERVGRIEVVPAISGRRLSLTGRVSF